MEMAPEQWGRIRRLPYFCNGEVAACQENTCVPFLLTGSMGEPSL